jgi:alpha-tubulin suppressor-like RCC1 family protein
VNGYGNPANIGDTETPFSAGDVPIGGPVTHVSLGYSNACAVLDNGAVRCWGSTAHGELGYGDSSNTSIGDDETPASMGDVNVGGRAVQVSVGTWHTCALLDTGAVRCWGDNEFGQLGYANTKNIGDDEPAGAGGDVVLGGAAIQISAGSFKTCALLATGSVRCWGYGADGGLGYGNTNNIGDNETPASAGDVPIGGRAVQVSAGSVNCALLESGNVRCWGFGLFGALGYGNTNNVGDDETPASVGDVNVGAPVAQIATGWNTCALLTNGNVRCWGRADWGLGYMNQETIGDNETPASAGDVNIGGTVAQVAVGGNHACAFLTSGALRCWGAGYVGQLGYGNINDLSYKSKFIGDDETPASAGDVPVLVDAHVHSCNGTASPCAVMSETNCKTTSRCMWIPPCVANPNSGPQSSVCRKNSDQATCSQHPECDWFSTLCGVNQYYCPSVTTQAQCTPGACIWQPASSGCAGFPNCMQILDEFSCAKQPGCSWD